MNRINLCIVVFLLNILLMTGCFAEPAMQSTSKIVLSGAMLKASALAYAEFSASLSRKKVDGELSQFLAEIGNYNVLIDEDATSYLFTITPKPYKGQMLKGGGAGYIFGKVNFNLVEAKYYK